MAKNNKKWFESKTIWLGIITAIIGIFSLLESTYPQIGIFVTLTGITNIILRTVTATTIE